MKQHVMSEASPPAQPDEQRTAQQNPALLDMMQRVNEAARQLLDDGSKAYDRARMLPRLVVLPPAVLIASEPEQTRHIILALLRAARAERARAGHWTYDLNRHIGLNQALQAERARLLAWYRAHT